jgi:hypothetical protein
MLIRPAIDDTDPIRYRRPTPDGQFSGNIIDEAMRGSKLGSDSDLMMFSAELAILRRGNQDHASQHSNFVARAEWVGYRERK